MPLVRIAVKKGQAGLGRQVGAVVRQALADTISLRPLDRLRICAEHDSDGLAFDPAYFGSARCNGVVLIQVTLAEAQSDAIKQTFHEVVTRNLRDQARVRAEIVFID